MTTVYKLKAPVDWFTLSKWEYDNLAICFTVTTESIRKELVHVGDTRFSNEEIYETLYDESKRFANQSGTELIDNVIDSLLGKNKLKDKLMEGDNNE
jgi:hypothetical protein